MQRRASSRLSRREPVRKESAARSRRPDLAERRARASLALPAHLVSPHPPSVRSEQLENTHGSSTTRLARRPTAHEASSSLISAQAPTLGRSFRLVTVLDGRRHGRTSLQESLCSPPAPEQVDQQVRAPSPCSSPRRASRRASAASSRPDADPCSYTAYSTASRASAAPSSTHFAVAPPPLVPYQPALAAPASSRHVAQPSRSSL